MKKEKGINVAELSAAEIQKERKKIQNRIADVNLLIAAIHVTLDYIMKQIKRLQKKRERLVKKKQDFEGMVGNQMNNRRVEGFDAKDWEVSGQELQEPYRNAD